MHQRRVQVAHCRDFMLMIEEDMKRALREMSEGLPVAMEPLGRRDSEEQLHAVVVSSPTVHPSRPKKRKRLAAEEVAEPLLSPWTSLVPKSEFTNLDQRLHQEIATFVDFVQQTPQEKTARDNLLAVLQKLLRTRFPKCELKLHGSTVTDLSLPGADIDMILVTPKEMSRPEQKDALHKIAHAVKTALLADHALVLHRARVPIVKFKTLPEYGSLSVDIGINNTEGLRVTELVKAYMSTMPCLRPLVLAVKTFLSQRGLSNPAVGGLGSYAITCMVLSFLQLNPSGRPTDYLEKPMANQSLGMLFSDFLFYYGLKFPYTTSYISVTSGKLLPKESAQWITVAPDSPAALVIQCLVNPENDVTRPTFRIDEVREAFKVAFATILALPVKDESLLGSLLSLRESKLQEREHIHALVDSGTLSSGSASPPSVASRTMVESPRRRERDDEQPEERVAKRAKMEADEEPVDVPYRSESGAASSLRSLEVDPAEEEVQECPATSQPEPSVTGCHVSISGSSTPLREGEDEDGRPREGMRVR
uniref:polynucleotide adenylyltransferase n=1 Tax=Mycena chlorophos TaxID=658473 RepID=A0ABQ0L9Z3_MYCCL|nr:nucleotidyltransferase [Mycena chlorophos]